MIILTVGLASKSVISYAIFGINFLLQIADYDTANNKIIFKVKANKKIFDGVISYH